MSGTNPWPTTLGLGSMSEDDIVRRCAELLDDPVLAAVMNQIDSDAVLVWRRSNNPAQREDAWMRCAVIADMRQGLNRVIESVRLETERNRRKDIRRD